MNYEKYNQKEIYYPYAQAIVFVEPDKDNLINETLQKNLTSDEVKAHILFEVIVYSILFVIGACGNLHVLYKLTLRNKRKTSLNILISQLNVADLIVIMVTIPIEIFFDLTNSWGKNILTICQIVQTLRTLGFYLSSMILICISIDRYYAFVHPLTFYNTRERNKKMVIFAWIASILLSIPQSTIVHLKYYPQVEGLVQCITFGYLKNKYMAAIINLKSILALYFAPLIIIFYCYIKIILAIYSVPDFMKTDSSSIKKIGILPLLVAKEKNKKNHSKISTSKSYPSYSGFNLEDKTTTIEKLTEEKFEIVKIKKKNEDNIIPSSENSSINSKINRPRIVLNKNSPNDKIKNNKKFEQKKNQALKNKKTKLENPKCHLKKSLSEEEIKSLKLKKTVSSLEYDLSLSQENCNLNYKTYPREILMSRAKRKTLKMTIMIVLAFVFCWTPYVTMALWHQLLEESARQVNEWVQELFFLLAVANSCVNPIVYSIHM